MKKSDFLSLGIFEDNEYLDLYVSLINSNVVTEKQQFKTQCHHILPKCYFVKNNLKVNNSKINLVNLLFKDHLLAHCYLALCSVNTKFRYYNRCAVYRLLNHRDFKDLKDVLSKLDIVQIMYENTRNDAYANNPMFNKDLKDRHDIICRSESVKSRISKTLKDYRKSNPFTDDHRKKLSTAAKGNHHFGTGDTRSISCYCILNTGETFRFHSYKEAGKWWYNTNHPFGDSYSETIFQRKIKDSINKKKIVYKGKGSKIMVNNITWYKDGDVHDKVS